MKLREKSKSMFASAVFINMFKVNNRNARTLCIVSFEHILHLVHLAGKYGLGDGST